jgi:MFS transporter, putative metabolite:H+ symporter
MASKGDDLLAAYDAGHLSARYWASMLLIVLQSMFDFFDFFIVGYVVAVLAPDWHLTYAQSSSMLVGAGLGAIIGSLALGKLADRVGRKPVLVASNLIVAAGATGIALMPAESWVLFSLLRILVGFGLGAAAATQATLTVEMTPTRYRTLISSLMVAPASLGIMLAAALASTLLPLIGWRGLAGIGALPALLGLAMIPIMPESPRWLMSQGRFAEARHAAARQLGVDLETLPVPAVRTALPRPAAMRELLLHPKAFWLIVFTWLGISTTTYGYQLWGPTILSGALKMPVSDVAGYFTVVGISGLIGRFVFSLLPLWMGRRRAGQVMGFGAAIFILCAGLFHANFYGAVPAFIFWLTFAAVFVNGGFSNMAPYAPETYPVRLAASAAGFSQAVNGVGKMLGPLALGLIAGSGNLITPQSTDASVIPGFTFLAACCVMAGLAYTFLPIETNGKSLALTEEPPAKNLSERSYRRELKA